MTKNGGHARELLMETVVGLFIVLIFIGVGVFTIVLSKDYWFKEVYTLSAQFDDIMGLREGDSVVVRGMKAGNVGGIELLTNRVVVTMKLESDIPIRAGYSIRIMPSSVLGGQYLHIDQGPLAGRVLSPDTVFDGQTPPDLMNEAALLVGELRKRLFEGGIIDDLERTTASFRVIAERVEKGEGFIGKLMSPDETLYNDLTTTVSSVKMVVERVEQGKGSLGKLLSDDTTLYDNLLATTETLASLSSDLEQGKGTLGKLLSDDTTLYDNLLATTETLASLSSDLAQGKGTLGKLLSEDDALYTDLHDTVKSLKAVAQKIERGEGLLGKLTSDETLYTDIQEVVGEARATLDDFRESSPVVTFSSIFFGAF